MPHTLTKPNGMTMKDDVWKNLDKSVAEAFISTYKTITGLRSQLDSRPTSQPLDLSGKDGGIMDDMSNLQKRSKLLEDSIISLQGTLGSFAFDDSYQRGMKQSIVAMDEFMGSAEAGKKAYESLSKSLRGFQQLNSKVAQNVTDTVTKESVKLTSALSNQAAVLNQLGLSYGTFSKGVDSAIFSFGLNADQVQKFNFQIKDMANTLKMVPEDVASNFNRLTKTMAYDLETIRGQFLSFQKLSLQTGVGFDTLTSKFGSSMDTISGASSAAANINMLLGRNVFSATEIMTMPDAERAEAMRDAIMSDPSIMADIERGGATGKFALQTVAENMNMSVDDARRFITTGEKPEKGKEGSVKSQIANQLDSTLGKTTTNFKDLQKGVVNLTDAFATAQEEILLRVSPNRRALLLARQKKLQGFRKGEIDTNLFTDIGQNMDLGIMPAGLESGDVVKALMRTGTPDRNIKRVIEGIQGGLIDVPSDKLSKLFQELTTTKDEEGPGGRTAFQIREQAQGRLTTLRQKADTSKRLKEVLEKMGPGAKSGFALVEENSPFAARVISKKLIELSKANNQPSIMALATSLIGINTTQKKEGEGIESALKKFGEGETVKKTFGTEFAPLLTGKKDKTKAATTEELKKYNESLVNSDARGVVVTARDVDQETASKQKVKTIKKQGKEDIKSNEFGRTTFIFRAESAVINGVHTKGPVEISAQSAMETVAPK